VAFERLNEPAFVARAVAGDPDAFEELFGVLAGPLAQFVERMGLSAQDAAETAADALIKVRNALPRFESRGSKLTTWIFQIARNSAIDRLREQNRQTALEKEILAEYERAGGPVDQPLDPRLGVLRGILGQAISGLNEGDRDILLMREVMEYADIARAEGISEEAARARHKRAFDRLVTNVRKGVPDA
jgi:RNA polymerase sigma factor (sigma-70 family)